MGLVVCMATCWDCRFGDCHDPPKWHSWPDVDDVEWALSHRREDPRNQRCNCPCADAPKVA